MNKELIHFLLGVKPQAIAEKVILVPFLPLKMFKDHFENVEKTFSGKTQYKGFTGVVKGQKISVISTGQGSAAVGDLVINLKGVAQKLVLAGSAGALNPELTLGDYVLPVEAIDGEGFSYYYLKNPKEEFIKASKVSVHQELLSVCNKLPIQKGVIYSIGSLTAEDNILLELLKNQGIGTIDMETSAFYTAAKVSDIKGLALHFVSDLPLSKPFYKKMETADQQKINYAMEGFPKTIIDLVLSL